MKRVLAFVFAALLLLTPSALAQDPTPEPGPNAAKMLPDPSTFGKGWVQIHVSGLDASADIFREAAVASYGGPKGSQVIVYVYLVTESRVAVRQSWEEATSLFDTYRYRLNYSYSRDESLELMPAPEGCVEAKRSDGQDSYSYLPSSVTLCAADPDVIVLAVVTGGIDGISDYSISDWVAGSVASGAELAKPTEPAPDPENA